MDVRTSRQLIDKIATVKAAEESVQDLLAGAPDVTQRIETDARNKALRNIAGAGLVAGGGTVALRGLQGLWGLINRSGAPDGPSRTGIAALPIPVHTSPEEEEEEELYGEKVAAENYIKSEPDDYASWYWPGMFAAALGGGYGGWKLSDQLFDQRRQEEVEDELEKAKQEFQTALTTHHTTPKVAAEKTAAQKLGEELDDLFCRLKSLEVQEKRADGPIQQTGNLLGSVLTAPGKAYDWLTHPRTREKAMGAYGVYAIPSALATYLAAKGITDKYSRKKVLEKAVSRRKEKRHAKRPSELYAVPVAIPGLKAKGSDWDEEEEEKYAGFWSEVGGGLAAPVIGGLAGAAGGAALGGKGNRAGGASLGAMLGAYGPHIGGSLAALATPTRNAMEQAEADEDVAANYMPGVASYNQAKRLGHSIRSPEIKAMTALRDDEEDYEELLEKLVLEHGSPGG